MSESGEESLDPATARKYIHDLPPDPADLTQSEHDRIGDLLLCDHHGVVHITAELVRDIASRTPSAIEPLLPVIVEAIIHTDRLRRPPLIDALDAFDTEEIARHDPIGQCHRLLSDEDADPADRAKAAAAFRDLYALFQTEVRETVPTLLECLGGAGGRTLSWAAGRTLGFVAANEQAEQARIVERFESELATDEGPKSGVAEGVEAYAVYSPDHAQSLVDRLVVLATSIDAPTSDDKADRWRIVGRVESIAETEPNLLASHIGPLRSLLTAEKSIVVTGAVKTLGHIAETDPEAVEPAVDDLIALSDHESAKVRRAVMNALTTFGDAHDTAAERAIQAHATQLTQSDGLGTHTALSELGQLSEEYPDKVVGELPVILERLAASTSRIRSGAAAAIEKIGSQRPDAVRPVVSTTISGYGVDEPSTPLVDRLTDGDEYVRESAALALGRIGAAKRSLVEHVLEPVVDVGFEDSDSIVEMQAVKALGLIGQAHPEVIDSHHVSALVTRLGNYNASIRSAAAEAIGNIGAADSETVSVASQPLIGLLDDHVPRTRTAACLALARLGVEDAAPEIAPLREDYDEDARDAAAEALNELGWVEPDEAVTSETRGDEPSQQSADSNDEAISSETGARQDPRPDPGSIEAPSFSSVSFDDITTESIIGRGGNAIVRAGTVDIDGTTRQVAVKEPVTEGTQTNDDIEAFEREARRWEQLSDRDHVVSVVGWGVDPLPWITLEYMDGGPLTPRVEECTVQEALYICERVAQAVRHDQTGMAHLDLKPANILFRSTSDGVWDIPKVADWGIAQLLNEHSATSSGKTATYAAPEQFDPDTYGSPDSRTDIYQLGVILYELLVGDPPFTGSDVAVMQSVLNDQPTPPSERVDGLPTEVDETVATALATEPADRFETMERFQACLQSVQTNR